MKTLFLTLYSPTWASPRYRVHQYLPALEAAGIACSVASAAPESGSWACRHHLSEHLQRRRQLSHLKEYECVVVQKALTSAPIPGLVERVARDASRLLLDVDDAVHLTPPDRLPRGLRWLEASQPQTLELMRLADTTLAGNHWLASETVVAGGRPIYLPTVVDTERFTPGPQPDNVYRLGWMGSPSTVPHLNTLAGVLAGQDVLVVGSGDTSMAFSTDRIAWFLEDEVRQIQRMSVGLMPLPRDTWTLGKCALKALLYMACGRPVIATRYGAACDVIVHGQTGLLVDTEAEWREAIERLRDPIERARMGEAGRAHVEANFSLREWAPRYVSLLRGTR